MNSLLHATNIVTFALWLSISGASTVGMVFTKPESLPGLEKDSREEIQLSEGELMEVEMQAGGSAAAQELDSENNEETLQQSEATAAEIAPEIPEMPEVAETAPLPDVPDFPEPKPVPNKDAISAAKPAPAPSQPALKRAEVAHRGVDRPVARRTETGTGTGSGSVAAKGTGSGTSGADRFSGSRRPKPTYPPSALKQGIKGIVRVSVTFGEDGRVMDAFIVSAAHPALNDPLIIQTIKSRWSIRPGPKITRIAPINFNVK